MIKEKFGSGFRVCDLANQLREEYATSKRELIHQHGIAQRALGVVIVSENHSVSVQDVTRALAIPIIEVAQNAESKKLAQEPILHSLDWRTDLIKYLLKVLNDNNMQHFWKYQIPSNYCCFFGGCKTRIGDSQHRQYIPVPTGISQIKEVLRSVEIKMAKGLNDNDLTQFLEDIRKIVSIRLTKGKGRKEATKTFLETLNKVIDPNNTAMKADTELNHFKLAMQNLRYNKIHYLDFSVTRAPEPLPLSPTASPRSINEEDEGPPRLLCLHSDLELDVDSPRLI